MTDALLEKTGSRCTIVCPAMPDNGRVVRDGVLYVNGVPLAESPMRAHPVTPMWDSDLTRLMGAQSRHPCRRWRGEALERLLEAHSGAFTLVPDHEDEADAVRILGQFGRLPLLTGGSGLLRGLARLHAGGAAQPDCAEERRSGRLVVISGSCSEMTQKQVAAWIGSGKRAVCIEPDALLDGRQTAAGLARELDDGEDLLLYSTADAEAVRRSQRHGAEKVSRLLEETMAGFAREAVRRGVRRLIIAGGETSSAALQKLGFEQLEVGESLAPGVPLLRSAELPELNLALKSGNFGREDFFLNSI